jgi:hypothetical protein
MFEKIGRLAEAAASNVSVSRRGFLGHLGRGALATAAVAGALLILPRDAQAGPPPPKNCLACDCKNTKDFCYKGCTVCPDYINCWMFCLCSRVGC